MSPGGHLGDPERPRSPTRPSRGPHGGPHRALGAPPDRRGEGHTWPHGALSPGVRRSDPVPQMQLSETLPPPGLRRGSAWEGSSEPGGQEGRPPYLWRLWPARLHPWGSGAPPHVRDPPPPPGRQARAGLGSRGRRVCSPLPRPPEPSGPLWARTQRQAGRAQSCRTPCRAPEAPGERLPRWLPLHHPTLLGRKPS